MKKQYYIITLLFALLVGMTTSCEDRLNIPKHGNMGSMDDYYQTDSEVESALASMYLSWRSAYYNWWFVKMPSLMTPGQPAVSVVIMCYWNK